MLLTKLTLLSVLISLTHAGPLQALPAALPPRQSPSFKNTNGIVNSLPPLNQYCSWANVIFQVIMCTEANWKGKCITLSVPTDDTCVQLQAPFLYNVSAIEPAFGTVCWRYTYVQPLIQQCCASPRKP